MRPRLAALAPVLLAAALPALADGFIIVERPPRRTQSGPFPLAVDNHDVTVEIDGQVATTSIDQTFRNPLNARLEGTYMFPLPEDAAVTDFSLWIDGEETPSELLEAGKALEIYEGIVRRMKDPALLEYAGRGMFKVRIFPIEPRSTRRIRITYRQVLEADAGRVRYRYPLNTEKFSSEPLERASIVVRVSSPETPIKGIYCPSHEVDVVRDGEHAATASWEATRVKPSRDFVLDYDLAPGSVGLSLRTHALPAEDGTFLLLAAPQVEAAERVAQDVVFVLDTSGTMAQDGKIEQAKKALAYCIYRLDAADRFAVVDFATAARAYRDELIPANEEYKAGAQRYVTELRARGGTAIDEALKRALGYRPEGSDRPFNVVFLTDGQPTIGEVEPDRILENVKAARGDAGNARVFVWGVGHDLNAHLLDRLALDNRGQRNYVLPGEDIEVAVSSFYDKISSPVLTDLELSFSGVRVHDVYPRELPDLFHGSQLVVTGRFSGEGHGAVTLTGEVNGEPREFVWEGAFARDADANPHVARLWARRKIGFLLDQIRLHGEAGELKDEVMALARRYGIPTPYTSYLVLEEGALERPTTGRPRPEPRADRAPAESAAEEAFGRLRDERQRRGQGGGAAAPAPGAPDDAAGEGAVRRSRELARLREGDADVDELLELDREVIEEAIRTVAGRTFYRQGDLWVESTVPPASEDAPWEEVEAYSDAYFALLREHPEAGPFLALGDVVFQLGDAVYEVRQG